MNHEKGVEMAQIKMEDLVLRCYGYRLGSSPLVGVCLDLNIAVQADTQEELMVKMKSAIESYFECVLDTDDRSSVVPLVTRRAPLRDWFIYYFIRLIYFIRKLPSYFTFKELIPIRLPNRC